jgi:predicted nicotinamide N-methyase
MNPEAAFWVVSSGLLFSQQYDNKNKMGKMSHMDPTTTHSTKGAMEERGPAPGSLRVTLGWGCDITLSDDSCLHVELPTVADTDSLASTLWPASLALAILCRSPSTVAFLHNKSVLDLGCGLGLAGLVAADSARSCQLTDNDATIVGLLRERRETSPKQQNVTASLLDWRNNTHADGIQIADVVIGSDIAYYHFLLRYLMDTTRRFLKPKDSVLLVAGQANRESQWNLYHNILNGCYNQHTDEREGPWVGVTQMLLYHLEMSKWHVSTTDVTFQPEIDGVIAIAALVHQTPGSEQISRLTECDYIATEEDEDKMLMTF